MNVRVSPTMLAAEGLVACGLAGLAACGPTEAPPSRSATEPLPAAITAPVFGPELRPYDLVGPLIPAATTMVSAWDIPRNPLTDPALGDSRDADRIRRGYRLFVNTPVEAPHLAPAGVSCGNCHLNAGQRERALPLVGSAAMFPEYNRRAGRDFTLEDRIVGCFMRSENAPGVDDEHRRDPTDASPSPSSEEVLAVAAYVRWLSEGYTPGVNPPWRKQNTIPEAHRVPIDQLDPREGEALFVEHCASCHGEDGQGVQIADKKAGPLWGPESWNDGAGAARVYTLAGMVRHMMPYLNPGVLTDAEAQHIAAFITSKPRPSYPYKDQDYLTEPLPIDAVYYRRGGRR